MPDIGNQIAKTEYEAYVTITRHGRTAAFIVSPQDMLELQQLRGKRTSAVEAFEVFFAQADTTLLPAATELTDAATSKLVKAAR